MQSSTARTQQIPRLLNERFSVAYYDGGVFSPGDLAGNFDVENVLVPTRDVFHCSDNGTHKNLILKCSSDFTLTHIFIQAPKKRCSDPIRHCLAWVGESMPNVEHSRYFDDLPIEVIKSKFAESEPIVISTNSDSLEGEAELRPWRHGRYVHLKFFDTHSMTQNNIDIAVVGLVGFTGHVSRDPQPEIGTWFKRHISPRRTVHPHTLSSAFSSRGWCCDGRDFSGGCRGGFNDFNETSVYDVSFRCTSCGFDLCEYCAADHSIGQVSKESASHDLSRLRNERNDRNIQARRLAFSRIRNSLRIDPGALGEYLESGILNTLGRFRYGNAREAGMLLSQILARLNPRPIGATPSDTLHLVCTTSGELRAVSLSPNQTTVGSDLEAACIDLLDGSTNCFHKSWLVPVSNKLDQVEATAKIFAIARGDLDPSNMASIVSAADLTIPNGLGESVFEIAKAFNNQELLSLMTPPSEEAGGEFELELIEASTAETKPTKVSRKHWLSELRKSVVDRLVQQLSNSDTLDGELVRSLILMEPEFTEEVRLLTLRLINSAFATDVANAVRLMGSSLQSDLQGLAAFGALAWAKKAAGHLANINSSIDVSADMEKLERAFPLAIDPSIVAKNLLGRVVDVSDPSLMSESELIRAVVSQTKKPITNTDTLNAICEYLLLRENLPVHKLVSESSSASSRSGFAQMTSPLTVSLAKQVEVQMEPLVSLGQIKRLLFMSRPIVDLTYLRFCYELIGCWLDVSPVSDSDQSAGPSPSRSSGSHSLTVACSGKGLVTGFDISTDLNVGFHSIKFENGVSSPRSNSSRRVVLANRDFSILNRESLIVSHADLRSRLTYERLCDASAVSELKEVRHLLNQPGELVVIENARSALHNVFPLIGLTHSPRGWLVPSPSGLDSDLLSILDTCMKNTSTGGGNSSVSSAATSLTITVPDDRIWSVAIQVDASEVPFELIWPMIREEVYEAVRPFVHRSWAAGLSRIEQSVVSGIHSASGLGPIARGLTREEAQSVSNRVAGVVQTLIVEDREAAIAAETERVRREQQAASSPSMSLSGPQISVGKRVKWTHPSFGERLGIVASLKGDSCDIIEESTSSLFGGLPSACVGGSRESMRESLRRRLGERLVPALIQLRPQMGEDPLLQAFTFSDEIEEEEEDEDEHDHHDDNHHEEEEIMLEEHHMEEDHMELMEQGANERGIVVRTVRDTSSGGPVGGLGGLGNFFLSIGDLLSGVTMRESSSSDSVVIRDIPGLVRGANVNAPIGERYSGDDLMRPANDKPHPLPKMLNNRVSVEVRACSTSCWTSIDQTTEDLPLLALFRDSGFFVPKTVNFETRFVSNTALCGTTAGSVSSGSAVPHKRQRMASSDSDGEPVMSPRYSLAGNSDMDNYVKILSLLDPRTMSENPLYLLIKETMSRRLSSQLDQVAILVCQALVRDQGLSLEYDVLPIWLHVLPELFPHLFPETLRLRLVQVTSFPGALTVHWIQQQRLSELLERRSQLQSDLNTESVTDNPRRMQALSQELSNVEERISRNSFWLGCVKSCLAKLRKTDEFKLMSQILLQRVSKSPSLLEIQFEGESGFGSAVTRSFFSELAKQFLLKTHTCLWITTTSSGNQGEYIAVGKRGLRLRPRMNDDTSEMVIQDCLLLGRLIGRALAEGYILPIPICEETWAMIRDPSADRPVTALPMPGDGTDGEFIGACAIGEFPIDWNDIGAVFVETGFSGPELMDNGAHVLVNSDNVNQFVSLATNYFLHTGIDFQLAAIRHGINEVLPVESLLSLTPSELKTTVCGEDEIAWTETSLRDMLHFHEGISEDIQDWLIETLLELDNLKKSAFLDFVTSCPRMPPGGSLRIDVFSEIIASSNLTSPALRPSMPPVVMPATPFDLAGSSPESARSSFSGAASPLIPRMSSEDGGEVIGYPRSRACVCHLYLPRYKSQQTLKERLIEAMVSSVHHDEITG